MSFCRTLCQRNKGVNGSAEWNVIFEAGKKPRLKFLSGSHELDILKPEMEAANYTFQLPSDVNTPLAIKGIVSCSSYSGCMLVLTPPLGFMYPGVINVISR